MNDVLDAAATAACLPWPALTDLGGELIFERSSMQVRGASGGFAGSKGLRLSKVEARIPDLAHTVVGVSADARGPLAELGALHGFGRMCIGEVSL